MKIFKNYFSSSKSSGYTLITVVFIVTILVILASIGLGIALTEVRLTKNQQGSVEALYAAETGANRALFYLEDNGPGGWKSAFEGVSSATEVQIGSALSDGKTYEAKVYAFNPAPNLVRARIESVGKGAGAKGIAQRKVQVTVEKGITTVGVTPYPYNFVLYSAKDFTYDGGYSFEVDKSDLWTEGDLTIHGLNLIKNNGQWAYYFGGWNVDTNPAFDAFQHPYQYAQKPDSEKMKIGGPDISKYEQHVLSTSDAKKVVPPFMGPPFTPADFSSACNYTEEQIMSALGSQPASKVLPKPPPENCDIKVTNLTGHNLTVSNFYRLEVKGGLYVDGDLNLENINLITINGPLVVKGKLKVSDVYNLTIKGDLYVEGETELGNINIIKIEGSVVSKGDMIIGGGGAYSLDILGDVYVDGNLILRQINIINPIDGYIVTRGGLVAEGGYDINAKGIYLLGEKSMPGGYPAGSLVLSGNNLVKLQDGVKDGELYVKGRIVGLSGYSLKAGNIQIDGENPNPTTPVLILSNINILKVKSILLGEGDLLVKQGYSGSFDDIKATKGNVTFENYNLKTFGGTVYAGGNLTMTGGYDFSGLSNVNFYSGGDLTIKGQNLGEIKGVVVGAKSITFSDGYSLKVLPPDGGGPSGLFTGGVLNISDTNLVDIIGLVWAKKGINIGKVPGLGGGTYSFKVKGGIVSGEKMKFTDINITKIEYDKTVLDVSYGGLSGGSGTSLKVLDWRESY